MAPGPAVDVNSSENSVVPSLVTSTERTSASPLCSGSAAPLCPSSRRLSSPRACDCHAAAATELVVTAASASGTNCWNAVCLNCIGHDNRLLFDISHLPEPGQCLKAVARVLPETASYQPGLLLPRRPHSADRTRTGFRYQNVPARNAPFLFQIVISSPSFNMTFP